MTRKLPTRAGLPALLILLISAAVAWAAPDRTAELTAAAPTFEWDGGPVNGIDNNDQDPDDTLVKLAVGGSLAIAFSEASDTAQDIDIQLYRSTAAGEPGAEVYVSTDSAADETYTHKNLAPGYYLIRASGWLSVGGTYKGAATLTPTVAAPAPGTAGTGVDARPAARLARVAKKIKAPKLKGFKGTAADDKAVKAVQLALVLQKGKKCSQLTAKGKFASARCGAPTSFVAASGTTKWTFKLKKKLAKGSYTVFARAIDSADQVQNGLAKASFKVS